MVEKKGHSILKVESCGDRFEEEMEQLDRLQVDNLKADESWV